MKPRKFVIVHGINTWTAAPGWNRQLAHKIESDQTTDKAFDFPWTGGPVRSVLFREYNARLLRANIDMMLGVRLHGVTHSYGAVLLQRAIRLSAGYVEFKRVFLFHPACVGDLEKSGYADLLRDGKIHELLIYGSNADRALAEVDRNPLWRWAGYGSLGYREPVVPDDIKQRVRLIYPPGLDHNWWPRNLTRLYEEVTA